MTRLFDELTEQQEVVLSHMYGGATNKEIARALHIAIGTVQNHVCQILYRLGVGSRTEAACLYAHRLIEAQHRSTPEATEKIVDLNYGHGTEKMGE